ncbi:hypothetical protein JCM24511_09792 [Saitozyma sp. JCM 24511]|nr:hypothetical protein JCM24511_09792 [Saitozyma sp. JCM 24511]
MSSSPFRAAGHTGLQQRTPSPVALSFEFDRPQSWVGVLSRSPSSTSATPTPLPYAKLLPLLISRISEGLIFSVIFPYINEMVHSFGIREKDVGVWSAMAESALMVCEALTAPLYAPLADRLGRRPVLLVCLLFWGLFAVCFGLVQSVWATIVMRGTLGLLAGAGVITRTMCGELCDKTNRIQGFAVFSPSITIGVTLGPLVGGFLANPVPRLLPPSWTLFEQYPYLLPAIVSGSTGILAFISGLFLTPETLPPSMRREHGHRDAEKGSRAGLRGLLSYKPYQNVLILYGRLLAYPFAVLFCPALWALHRADTGSLGVAAWAVLVTQMIVRRTGDFAATMLDTMVLDSIPGPEHLALANSLTFSVAAVGRAIGPFIISWSFSLSTSFSSPWSPGRQLVWIVFILLCLPSIYLAHRMEADRPPGQGSDDEEDDEERHELIERRSGSEEGEHEFEHEHVGQLGTRRRDSS